MPGETEEKPSGWTVDTLRVEMLGRLEAMDRRYEERFEAQEKAVLKAEIASEKRFDSVNEFRATLSDQTATLMPRAESTLRWEAASERIAKLESYGELVKGRGKGMADSWGYLLGLLGAVATAITIILAFNN